MSDSVNYLDHVVYLFHFPEELVEFPHAQVDLQPPLRPALFPQQEPARYEALGLALRPRTPRRYCIALSVPANRHSKSTSVLHPLLIYLSSFMQSISKNYHLVTQCAAPFETHFALGASYTMNRSYRNILSSWGRAFIRCHSNEMSWEGSSISRNFFHTIWKSSWEM